MNDDAFEKNAEDMAHAAKMAQRAVAGRLAKFAAKAAVAAAKAVLAVLSPALIWILIAFIAFMLIYGFVFALPQQIIQSDKEAGKGTAVSIFYAGDEFGWTMEDDRKLQEQYLSLQNKYKESADNVRKQGDLLVSESVLDSADQSQVEQAEPHKVPWAIMAAVDRFLGDPAMTGEKMWKPDPERTYNALKPTFYWRKSKIITTTVKTWEEEVKKSDGSTKKVKKTSTETSEKEVYLLEQVDAYDAHYDYIYEWKTEKKTEDSGDIHKDITIKKEELKTMRQSGPYYQKLVDLLGSYGLSTDDVELTLNLAMVYDESFAADTELLGNYYPGAGLQVDLTKKYWEGDPGAPLWPLDPSYHIITSPFGSRIHPIFKTKRFHTGMDITVPIGSNVYAAMNGRVIYTGNMKGYGKVVIIDHGDYKTKYAHLSFIHVKTGDEVKRGDVIALSGNTGLSTGPHLHYEVILTKGGAEERVNPISLYQ